MARPIVGVFVPQGWKLELASIPDPQDQWRTTVEIARLAEELGFDPVWVYDHVHNVPAPSNETVFECWAVVAALSQVTSRVRLGQMVGCTSYRSPALLAKITSTVDVISGGRLDWGIGAGWYEGEYRAYGYEFPEAKVRIGQLREAVENVKAMWTEPEATSEGRLFRVERAQCDPKPVQRPHPPVWIGGGGERLTLRVVARHADRSWPSSDVLAVVARDIPMQPPPEGWVSRGRRAGGPGGTGSGRRRRRAGGRRSTRRGR